MSGTLGTQLGKISVAPPGPNSRRLTAQLREVESRNITYVSADFPIFFSQAVGANVVDVDDNVYVDLSGFFGVAAAGHSNPRVADAIAAQAHRLLHGMGDIYPTENKVALAQELCELVPGDGPKEGHLRHIRFGGGRGGAQDSGDRYGQAGRHLLHGRLSWLGVRRAFRHRP